MDPIIFNTNEKDLPKSAHGKSFIIHEWRGSGPPYLHVHHVDDEAWYILEGVLTFRFQDRSFEALQGTMVMVPAGTPHTYSADASARYLIILTERLDRLIRELQSSPIADHPEIMKKNESEILK